MATNGDSEKPLNLHLPAAAAVAARIGDRQPRLGLVLGSGLGEIAERLGSAVSIPYSELPGFPRAAVAGHAGQLVVGELSGVSVACMQGRMHYYEGHPAAALAVAIRTLKAIGCSDLLLTNAAGSLRRGMSPGCLMMLTDHINWAGINPLIGPNDDTVGPRFFDMTRAYHPELQRLMRAAAKASGIDLHEGVYTLYSGPNFETPAEIRAMQTLGGDAVGMSTVPECLAAVHCGMRVAAVSTITNLAAGLGDQPLSHAETLAVGSRAAADLSRLIDAFVRALAE